MSDGAFSWIEDFEQDKNIVVEQVFGAYLKALGIPKPSYPEEWPEVLKGAGIWLKENFLDGYRFLEDPNPQSRQVFEPPLARVYQEALKRCGSRQSRPYSDLLNELQKNQENRLPPRLLIEGLYRMFWFDPVKQEIRLDDLDSTGTCLTLQFTPWDYHRQGPDHYALGLARHLYRASFGHG